MTFSQLISVNIGAPNGIQNRHYLYFVYLGDVVITPCDQLPKKLRLSMRVV
jgi:hypothetical protein